MSKIEPRPFEPYVTMEKIYAFNKDIPATHTASPLVNIVLSLFDDPQLRTATAMSSYLKLDAREISAYLHIATGYKLAELRRLWVLDRLEKLRRQHPYLNNDGLAKALGFLDHSSLWHFLNAEKQNRKQNEHRHRIDPRWRKS